MDGNYYIFRYLFWNIEYENSDYVGNAARFEFFDKGRTQGSTFDYGQKEIFWTSDFCDKGVTALWSYQGKDYITDIVSSFEEAKNNPALQAQIVRESNKYEDRENNMFKPKEYDVER